jgi:hypothetical protein
MYLIHILTIEINNNNNNNKKKTKISEKSKRRTMIIFAQIYRFK